MYSVKLDIKGSAVFTWQVAEEAELSEFIALTELGKPNAITTSSAGEEKRYGFIPWRRRRYGNQLRIYAYPVHL